MSHHMHARAGSALRSLRSYAGLLFGRDNMLPDGVVERLRSVKNLLVTIDNPRNSDIEQGINALIANTVAKADNGDERAVADRWPGLWSMYEQGYDPPVRPGELAALPPSTLGGRYARFMAENSIRPLQDMVRVRRPRSFGEWSIRRAYKLHDVMHTILDCDAEILGEVRINAWSVGQALSYSHQRAGAGHTSSHGSMGVAVLLMHIAFKRNRDFPEALALAVEWLERGRNDPYHLPLRVEQMWDRPLDEVRDLYRSGRFDARP